MQSHSAGFFSQLLSLVRFCVLWQFYHLHWCSHKNTFSTKVFMRLFLSISRIHEKPFSIWDSHIVWALIALFSILFFLFSFGSVFSITIWFFVRFVAKVNIDISRYRLNIDNPSQNVTGHFYNESLIINFKCSLQTVDVDNISLHRNNINWKSVRHPRTASN